MKSILVIILMVVAFMVVFIFTMKKTAAAETKVGARVKTSDIPAIFERLRDTAKDGNFAVFIFVPFGKSPTNAEAINIQFSIESGRVGLDWVLLGPPNIRDKEKFVQLAGKLGYKVIPREMNNVKYLRVEEGDSLPKLCETIIRDLYAVPSETELGLIPEGFAWP